MTSLFISYSRRDMEFARILTKGFQERELDFWIDWEGIPPTVDWWKEIEKGIEEADVFLFLISPDSVKSRVCKQEIEHAVSNGKRLIPLVVRDIKGEEAPNELAHLNWIFFRDTDDFQAAFEKLLMAINTDFVWVQVHRQLQVKALEWQRNDRENSFLLRGREMVEAESQLAANSSKQPFPTGLQREYVLNSRQAGDRQRRITTGIAAAVVIALAILSVVALVQAGLATTNAREAQAQSATAQAASTLAFNNAGTAQANETLAEERASIARAGELAAQSLAVRDKNLPLSLLLSVEAYNTHATIQTRGALLNNIQANSQLLKHVSGNMETAASHAFHPDGKTLAISRADNSIALWDVETMQYVGQPLDEHMAPVTSMVFGPDGRVLASADHNGTIILWDTKTWLPETRLQTGHPGRARNLAFSPDGRLLASTSCMEEDEYNFCTMGNLMVWDGQSDRPLMTQTIAGGAGFPDFTQDGNTLILSEAGTFILWDMETMQLIGQTLDLKTPFLTLSPDKQIVASTRDGDVSLWDVETGEALGQMLRDETDIIIDMDFSPDGTILALADAKGTITLWNVGTGQSTMIQTASRLEIFSVVYSPDGRKLASSSRDNVIQVWDMTAESPRPLYELGDNSQHVSLSFSPDGNTLISTKLDGTLIVWDVSTSPDNLPMPRQPIGRLLRGHASAVFNVVFSPNGKILASGGNDNVIILWDVQTGLPIGQPLSGHRSSGYSMAFSPDGNTLASGGGDDVILLWDVQTGRAAGSPLDTGTDGTQSMAFSPNGKILASAHWDGTMTLWDAETWQPLGQLLNEKPAKINSIIFTPDGDGLISGGEDGSIKFWDVETRLLTRQLQMKSTEEAFREAPFGISISPDGKILAAGDYFNNIILWSVATGQRIRQPLVAQTRRPISIANFSPVAFSPDGKTLISGIDGGIILWDVDTGQIIGQPLHSYDDNLVYGVAFNPDGKWAASVTGDGAVVLWDIDPLSWLQRTCERAGRNPTRAEWMQYFPSEDYRAICPQWPLEPEPDKK